MKFIFGAGLFLLGIIALSASIFGLIFCGLGAYFFHTDGIEINLEQKTYRNTLSLFSLTFGKWKDLPEIEYISVFATTQSTKVRALTAETMVKKAVIKVNLFYNTNRKIEAFVTEDTQKAFDVAKEIATVLNIDVLDATERESKWL
ncbi:hypothetical protein [Winogradskyella forsetii]|uniref:hypothetical protein n=1 Tax=Winogradskyella forsetii TaxID=2686077 RepID=UPI0015BAA884|nr:hypothetical protein [Winogradskyella forsetii]